MRLLVFEGETWKKFEALRIVNRTTHRKLCRSIQDMVNGDLTSGLNKTEPLRYNLKGFWSKTYTPKDRIVYKFDDEYIYIFAIGGSDI